MTEEDHALEQALEHMETIWRTAKEASEEIRKRREEEASEASSETGAEGK